MLAEPTFHEIFGIPVQTVPAGSEVAYLALGCFWGAEKLYWQTPGVTNTAVGYAGGYTPNPTYEEVCSAKTGHTEIVKVSYDPTKISYEQLLKVFFENHDPTQGMRQGNDVGTQYRSAIYTTTDEQLATASGSGTSTRPSSAGRATARSPPRSSRCRTSTTPRTTTSSTWTRTRSATARSTPPESPATEAETPNKVLAKRRVVPAQRCPIPLRSKAAQSASRAKVLHVFGSPLRESLVQPLLPVGRRAVGPALRD